MLIIQVQFVNLAVMNERNENKVRIVSQENQFSALASHQLRSFEKKSLPRLSTGGSDLIGRVWALALVKAQAILQCSQH